MICLEYFQQKDDSLKTPLIASQIVLDDSALPNLDKLKDRPLPSPGHQMEWKERKSKIFLYLYVDFSLDFSLHLEVMVEVS